MPFTDIKSSDWYYSAVAYVYENGIVSGIGSATFAPNKQLTRAEVVLILYNLEGQPEVTGNTTFTDVATHLGSCPYCLGRT